MDSHLLINFFVVVAILALIFLILREYICWFWKVNRIVELLVSIDKKLSSVQNVPGSGQEKEKVFEKTGVNSVKKCPHCSEIVNAALKRCPYCAESI
ncbi:MAG TPA: hypothetical protein PLZ43_15395 [bacterium]|nr:hypothetical protein [bacterium]